MHGEIFVDPIASLPAEMSVLGSMLLSERKAEAVCKILSAGDFYRPGHSVLFSAIKRLVDARKPVDFVTVKEQLMASGKLGDIGGDDYLIQIAEYTPSPANAEYYAEIVKEKAILRAVEEGADRLLRDIRSLSLDDLRVRAQKLATSAMTGAGSRSLLLRDVKTYGRIADGVASGYAFLDALTGGIGYPRGQATSIGALTKGGKTSFMTRSAWCIASGGMKVLYAPFADLTMAQIKGRIIHQLCGYSREPQQMDRKEAFIRAREEVDDVFGPGDNFRVYDSTGAGGIEDFAAELYRLQNEDPVDIVFLDYIQRIRTKDVDPRAGATARLEHVSRVINDIARDVDIPVVFGSQLTAQQDGSLMPKYAQAIAEDAGLSLILSKDEDGGTGRFARGGVTCQYNRFGPQKISGELLWDTWHIMYVEATGGKG
jgi:replicative DNA helicase